MKIKCFSAWMIGCTLLWALSAPAATISWTNDAGGAFSDAANWQGGVVPAENDLALFTNVASYTVTLTQGTTNGEARFSAAGGTVDLDLAGFSWTQTNVLYVGYLAGSDAQVEMSGGSLVSRSLQLGNLSTTAHGRLTLQGVTGSVVASSGLGVGMSGTGVLTLADADTVLTAFGGGTHVIGNSANAEGSLRLDSGFLSASGSLTVGNSGRGELVVGTGTGVLSSTLSVGISSGGFGRVILAGAGAELSVGGVNMAAALASGGELYLSNGLMRTRGETKWGDDGKGLLVLAGGTLITTNEGSGRGHMYFPFGSGTGILMLTHADSYLGQNDANGSIQVPNDTNGMGQIIVSNGMISATEIDLGDAINTLGEMFIYNATSVLNRSGAAALVIGTASGSTGLVVMADSRAMLVATNGTGIVLGGTDSTRSNSFGQLVMSNGTVVTRGLRLGFGTACGGEVTLLDGSIENKTNSAGVGTGLIVGDGLRSTGLLVMASASSVITATDGPAGTPTILGNSSGSVGRLIVSNGTLNLRRLVVANNGNGYVSLENQAAMHINEGLYMPNDSTGNGVGTGQLVLASANAVLNVTNGNLRIGGTWTGAKGGSGHLLVSNGTVNVKLLAPGQASDGLVTILDGTIQQASTAFGDGLKIGNSSEGGTGTVVLAHANALLNMPSNNLVMGNANNGTARLIISNGTVMVRAIQMGGLASQTNTVSEITVGNGTLISSHSDFQMGVSPGTIGRVMMVHPNAQIFHTNGSPSLSLNNRSNTWSSLIQSNGTLYAGAVKLGDAAFTPNHPQQNSEWLIYNATNLLSVSNSVAVMVAGKPGSTGLVLLAESGSVVDAPLWHGTTYNDAYVAQQGVGTLMVSNGLFRAGNLSIGNSVGSVGVVQQDGGRVEALNNVVIGNQGSGTYNLAGGTLVATNNGNGIDIGNGVGGSGVLNVSNGTVVTKFASTVGLGEASTAELNVAGGTVDMSVTQFSIGWGTSSVARLNVAGGAVSIGQLVVVGGSRATNCVANLWLSGGTLSVGRITSSLAVGAQSNIWLSGGTLAALGNLTNALATTLTNSPGAGQTTFDSSTNIILQSGVLTGPGGLAKAGAGQMTLTQDNPYTGDTDVDAGTLALQGSGALSGSAFITIASGATLSASGRSDGSLNVGGAQTLAGAGAVSGAVTNLGTVAPGGLVGALSVSGDYDQSGGGTLAAQLSGLGHDVLAVGGTATLGGLLDVSTLAYTPSAGNAYTVLTAGAVSGTFATTNLPALGGGSSWSVVYSTTNVVLSVTGGAGPTPYETWGAGHGLSGTNLYNGADPDGDGSVNLLEYAWGSNPTSNLSAVKLGMTLTNGTARLLIQRVNSATDIVYFVEAANAALNSASWSVLASNVLGVWTGAATVDDNNTGAVHEVRVLDTTSTTNRFLRLRIER
jgi:fibronectin-binding autotransporter adhesin